MHALPPNTPDSRREAYYHSRLRWVALPMARNINLYRQQPEPSRI